jgi:hypothetical protein
MATTADSDKLRLCTVCDKDNARLCARCKSAAYCSEICQKVDWRTHKLLCAAFSEFDVSGRPTVNHVRAVLFPVDKKTPQLIWLPWYWRGIPGDNYQSPVLDEFLGAGVFPERSPVDYNPILKRASRDCVTICCREGFLVDGSVPNSSVSAITSTKPGRYHDWRGPILAYSKHGPDMNARICKDLDMNDFRHAADYFRWYNYEPVLPASPAQPSQSPKVKGVRVNCDGDQKMFNKPQFEAVEIPATDPIFTIHNTSDIADRIGLPIFTRRCIPSPKWSNDIHNLMYDSGSPYNNQSATFLHLRCDPKAKYDPNVGQLSWFYPSPQWLSEVGSTIIMRQDKKPLHHIHAEALCNYCQYEVRPILSHSTGECAPEEPLTKEAALAMICRPSFVLYWYKFMDDPKFKDRPDYLPLPHYM